MDNTPKNSNIEFSACTVEEVLIHFQSGTNGLSDQEALERKKKFGPNEIPDPHKKSALIIFFKQLKSLLVLVLIIAAILSYLTGNYTDVYIIIIVVLIDAIIGFVQEWRAENAMASLQRMLSPIAKVIRKGELFQIPSVELVPGDIIVVSEGDNIPADARLMEARNLRTVEASLTGESLPENKIVEKLPSGLLMADQTNMIRKGTSAISGYGKAVVTATGLQTAIGQVAETLQSIPTEKSHFQKKIDRLAYQMGLASLLCALVFFLIGYFTMDLSFNEVLLISVAAMVSVIPEGLPSIIAVVLAIGANRMTKRNAIVREFTATETLGAITTIITDKTGTLTENALTARKIFLPGTNEIEVTGEGWFPAGNFIQNNRVLELKEDHPQVLQLLRVAAGSNNSSIRHNKETDTYELLGDPTEGALLVLARKGGIHVAATNKLDDLPFDSGVKLRATLWQENDQMQLLVVGAPEKILELSAQVLSRNGLASMSYSWKEDIKDKIAEWTAVSMRVIALAYKTPANGQQKVKLEDIHDLIFVGLVGMLDPPRAEVKAAMQECGNAGIRVIMATGDHASTAVAIARLTGMVEEKTDGKIVALTEGQLQDLDDKEFDDAILNVNVFARLTPQTKLKIASRLQEMGHLIAMTGDGVNDAPALKKADVGVAMGIMGTDVARDSAKVVLADDNFSTIVRAIEEGRIVFKNARQASFYLITTNFAEIVTLIVTIAMGLPMPLTAIQILWLNLVTDGIGDMAIAAERGHGEVMKERPVKKEERILDKSILPFMVINVLIMSVLSVLAYRYFLPAGIECGRSAVFIVMSFTQLFNMYNMRSLKKSAFEIGFFSNPFVTITLVTSVLMTAGIIQLDVFNTMFGFKPMATTEFLMLVAMSSLVLWACEVYKYFKREYR